MTSKNSAAVFILCFLFSLLLLFVSSNQFVEILGLITMGICLLGLGILIGIRWSE